MLICPRCGEQYGDDDGAVCAWDGTRLAPAPALVAGGDVLDTFGVMPSGVEIALVVAEEPQKRARPRRGVTATASFSQKAALSATSPVPVGGAPPAAAPSQSAPAPAPAPEPAVRGMPAVIAGRYRVEEVIGVGSFGSIFRVTHTQLGKPFALKRIHVDAATHPAALEAFYREARLASALDHPNIVSIVDFGEDPNIGAFMVMELLQGETLEQRLAGERRMHLRQVFDIILQAAEALHYIHDRDIVHGDIKPQNILLCRVTSAANRRRWQVKLLDFGIAQRDEPSARASGTVEGTPAYLAPERIKGEPPHPPVDIYALGCMAYEMIAGVVPFDGKVFEVLKAHIEREPEPPSAHLDEPLDERIEHLVLRAMAKDPGDRHKDMAAFIYELRTLMDMLGFRKRRRKPRRARRRSLGKDRRARGERIGYQLCPMPMAGIDVDGTVVVANRSFAKFVSGKSSAKIAGMQLYESVFADVYPQLAADVARVHKEGAVLQRELDIFDAQGNPMRLLAWVVPGVEDAGKVHITVQQLR